MSNFDTKCSKKTHQYKYGFSFSMLTELKGSRRNQVVKVKPVSCGQRERGGTMMAEPAFPGNEKNTSGPDLRHCNTEQHKSKNEDFQILAS